MYPDLSSWIGWGGGNQALSWGMSWSSQRDMPQGHNRATGSGRRAITSSLRTGAERGQRERPARAGASEEAGRSTDLENLAKLKPAAHGPQRSSKCGLQTGARAQMASRTRQGKGLVPSLTTSLWPSWAQTLDGFSQCAEQNRRAALNSTRARRMFAPTQTQMDSKPAPDKAKGLMSWQRGACHACCPDVLSERANSRKWPPSDSGLRTQTLMSAREVPLRVARTAHHSWELGVSK